MKKLLFAAVLIVASFSVKSQIVDTSVYQIAACKIVPFKAKFSDTSNVTHIGARVVSDDLKTACQLYFCFMDSSHTILMQGNKTIGGQDYQNWNGNNVYPFTYLGILFGLTYKTP